jgi:hypothetical protein
MGISSSYNRGKNSRRRLILRVSGGSGRSVQRAQAIRRIKGQNMEITSPRRESVRPVLMWTAHGTNLDAACPPRHGGTRRMQLRWIKNVDCSLAFAHSFCC